MHRFDYTTRNHAMASFLREQDATPDNVLAMLRLFESPIFNYSPFILPPRRLAHEAHNERRSSLDHDGTISAARLSSVSTLPSVKLSNSRVLQQKALGGILKHLIVLDEADDFSLLLRAQSQRVPYVFAKQGAVVPLGFAQTIVSGVVVLFSNVNTTSDLLFLREVILLLCQALKLSRSDIEYVSHSDWLAVEVFFMFILSARVAFSTATESSLSAVFAHVNQACLANLRHLVRTSHFIFGDFGGKLPLVPGQSLSTALGEAGMVHLHCEISPFDGVGPTPIQNLRMALSLSFPESTDEVAAWFDEHCSQESWARRRQQGVRCLVAVGVNTSTGGLLRSFDLLSSHELAAQLRSHGFDAPSPIPVVGGALGTGLKARLVRGQHAPHQGRLFVRTLSDAERSAGDATVDGEDGAASAVDNEDDDVSATADSGDTMSEVASCGGTDDVGIAEEITSLRVLLELISECSVQVVNFYVTPLQLVARHVSEFFENLATIITSQLFWATPYTARECILAVQRALHYLSERIVPQLFGSCSMTQRLELVVPIECADRVSALLLRCNIEEHTIEMRQDELVTALARKFEMASSFCALSARALSQTDRDMYAYLTSIAAVLRLCQTDCAGMQRDIVFNRCRAACFGVVPTIFGASLPRDSSVALLRDNRTLVALMSSSEFERQMPNKLLLKQAAAAAQRLNIHFPPDALLLQHHVSRSCFARHDVRELVAQTFLRRENTTGVVILGVVCTVLHAVEVGGMSGTMRILRNSRTGVQSLGWDAILFPGTLSIVAPTADGSGNATVALPFTEPVANTCVTALRERGYIAVQAPLSWRDAAAAVARSTNAHWQWIQGILRQCTGLPALPTVDPERRPFVQFIAGCYAMGCDCLPDLEDSNWMPLLPLDTTCEDNIAFADLIHQIEQVSTPLVTMGGNEREERLCEIAVSLTLVVRAGNVGWWPAGTALQRQETARVRARLEQVLTRRQFKSPLWIHELSACLDPNEFIGRQGIQATASGRAMLNALVPLGGNVDSALALAYSSTDSASTFPIQSRRGTLYESPYDAVHILTSHQQCPMGTNLWFGPWRSNISCTSLRRVSILPLRAFAILADSIVDAGIQNVALSPMGLFRIESTNGGEPTHCSLYSLMRERHDHHLIALKRGPLPQFSVVHLLLFAAFLQAAGPDRHQIQAMFLYSNIPLWSKRGPVQDLLMLCKACEEIKHKGRDALLPREACLCCLSQECQMIYKLANQVIHELDVTLLREYSSARKRSRMARE